MSEDTIGGAIAGLGWGIFIGFLIGLSWAVAKLKEIVSEDGNKEGNDV